MLDQLKNLELKDHRIFEFIKKIERKEMPSEIPLFIKLRCECAKSEIELLQGCTDKHFFDIVSVNYLTFGMICCFLYISFWLSLFAITFFKLLRTCGTINEMIYTSEIINTHGSQRRNQTLVNIIGDIISFGSGHIFLGSLSWSVNFVIILCFNMWASREGGDIISGMCWCVDRLGYTNRRRLYIMTSPLERYIKIRKN